jgi:hypothetical protein
VVIVRKKSAGCRKKTAEIGCKRQRTALAVKRQVANIAWATKDKRLEDANQKQFDVSGIRM